MFKNYLIYGVSKGLGKAILEKIPHEHDKVFGISRTRPDISLKNLQWIDADLSHPEEAISLIKNTIQNERIDVFIYNVGIWENHAFSENYDFQKISAKEIQTMINININACILSIQQFIDQLKLSPNAKIILIGSTWGLDNHNGKELIFSASKYALRGIAQSLREILRADHIGVTVLNLGYLATEYPIETPIDQVLEQSNQQLIPLVDVIEAIQFVISTSRATCVKEITMPAMADTNI